MFATETSEIPENIKLQVLPNLSPELKDKVEQFRATVTDMDGRIRTPQEEAQRFERYCSDNDSKKWILALKDNDLIGMTVVFGREIFYNEQTISLGGIGKVRVREDWRRKNIAKIMMNEAMKQLVDAKCDVAFLTTNLDSFLADFYKKYGFAVLNKPYVFSGYSGKRHEERDGMLAPITSKAIFQEIMINKEPLDIGRGTW